MATTVTFTLPASNSSSAGKVTMVNLLGRRWTFPAAPPQVDHKFPIWNWDEVKRPDQAPATVRTGKTLHHFTLKFTLGYQDGRSLEPDIQQLRGFASDGVYLTLTSYGASLGGLWVMVGDYALTSELLIPGSNDIRQAQVTLEFKRASDVGVLLTPITASSANDLPLPIVEKVAVAGATNDQIGVDLGSTFTVGDAPASGAGINGIADLIDGINAAQKGS